MSYTHQQYHFTSPVTEPKNEEDIRTILRELRNGIAEIIAKKDTQGGSYIYNVSKEKVKLLVKERINHIIIEDSIRLDVSEVVDQIRQYEVNTRVICGNCKNLLDEYIDIRGREQYCKINKTRKLSEGPCQENFENKHLPTDSRPLEEILEEI